MGSPTVKISPSMLEIEFEDYCLVFLDTKEGTYIYEYFRSEEKDKYGDYVWIEPWLVV